MSDTKPALSEVFFSHDGLVSDKWEQYLAIYQSELSNLASEGRPVRLLEIGVQNGGSLEVWQKFLPFGSSVQGLDVDPAVGNLKFTSDRISAAVGDATNPTVIQDILGNRVFDIIIDDGSHICSDVISTFLILFDHLAPGGKYIVEDLHTSYYANYGGGFRTVGSSIEWLKSLIDSVNSDHIAPSEFANNVSAEEVLRFSSSLARVTFYDSVCVVEKLAHEKTRPYRRLVTGSRAEVRSLNTLFPISALLKVFFVTPAARKIESSLLEQIKQCQEKMRDHEREISDRDAIILALRQDVERAEAEATKLRAELARAAAETGTSRAQT